ncbi:MAG: polymer-forming cytoskeletal protein [Longimicrobiales bacterium]|nr:polymer-forming cytoskeletal protein [Longimicrobiales bacterium]
MANRPVEEERRENAWIGPSVVISGNVRSSEDTTLAGRVDGDINVRDHTLIVTDRARVRGDVTAAAVVVHGEVVGTITAKRRVEVGETGSVDGDIEAPSMSIAEGATLTGRLKIASS